MSHKFEKCLALSLHYTTHVILNSLSEEWRTSMWRPSGTGASIELLELTARCPSRACWRPGWSHSCCWATFSSPVDWSSAAWCFCPLSCGGWIDSCTARSTSAWPTPTGVVSLLMLQARLLWFESWVNFHFQELLHLNNLLLSRAANHYVLAVVCYAQRRCTTLLRSWSYHYTHPPKNFFFKFLISCVCVGIRHASNQLCVCLFCVCSVGCATANQRARFKPADQL